MASIYWLDASGDWNNTGNWSTGSVPTTGDTVYILSGVQSIATNLNQSAVTLAALYIGQGFSGTIGTTSAALQISATNLYIGVPVTGATQGNGSGRIRLDLGSNASSIIVYNTGVSSTDSGLEPCRIIGSSASNTISVLGGRVGIGTTTPTQTATMTTANVTGGTLNYGYGVTWTTANVSTGGSFTAQTGGTTVTTAPSATATLGGTVITTTVNVGGTVYLNARPGSGNIATTVNLYSSGVADFTQNPGAGTIGTLNFYPGGTWKNSPANPNHVTATTLALKNGGTLTLS